MRSILSKATVALGAAALAGLASVPAAADAQCLLNDANPTGWQADVDIYPSGNLTVLTAGVVNFGTGSFGIGGGAADMATQDLIYFTAAGATHFFQPVVDWGNFSHGGVQTCRSPLVVYAAL